MRDGPARFRALLVPVLLLVATSAAPHTLPSRLSDSEFRQLIEKFSEPGGYFRSDNFLSNETAYQWVIPELQRTTETGGVYLGVGPEQNFTYIAALEPRMAFIVDIRRQNMLQHLMYKALFELAHDRAAFLSLLFSRPRPPGLDTSTSVDSLFRALIATQPDSTMYQVSLRSIVDLLVKKRGFRFSDNDLEGVRYVFSAFYSAGPTIDYGYPNTYGRGRFPSYAELMAQTDSAGVQRGYLATEANWRAVKALQLRNLIVPLTGDFAGSKALRAVGKYVRAHDATVSVFYTSNVEQYLWRQEEDWRRFYANVATLPVDSTSSFIRSVPRYAGGFRGVPGGAPGMRIPSLVSSIPELVRAFHEGRLVTYTDVILMSR